MHMLLRFHQASNLILQPPGGPSAQVAPTTPKPRVEEFPNKEPVLPQESKRDFPLQDGSADNDTGKTLEDFEAENLKALKERESKKKTPATKGPKVLKRPASKSQSQEIQQKKTKKDIAAKSKTKQKHIVANTTLGCGKCRGQGCASCRSPGFKGALYSREQWLARAKVLKLK